MKNFTWSWDEPEEMVEDELDMQVLDKQLDPDGLDEQGQAAWNALLREMSVPGLCNGCHRRDEVCICGGVPSYADKDIFVEGDDQEFLVEF